MTTKEVQVRRDTASNMAGATPAVGELFYDTTNKRLGIGDGSTVGGIPHVSATDDQKQTFVYPTVGGTGDAITLTNTFPVTAYTAPLKQVFKAGAANTGAVTVDVDGLGTKNLKKLSGGSLVALVANDLVAGGIYEIIYDGTQFQVVGGLGSGGGLPASVTGTLTSGTSVTFNVDFSTYSAYELLIQGMQVGGSVSSFQIEVSKDTFATTATATRNAIKFISGTVSTNIIDDGPISSGATVQFSGTLAQPSASGNSSLSYQMADQSTSAQFGSDSHSLSAAINQVKIKLNGGGAFSAGNVILQPLAKR
jgi:Major tropism determinant N-terminal domain